MKRCAACKIEKPFSEFSKTSKGDRHGLRSKCKACRSAQNSKWNQNNSERVAENMRRWRQENAAHIIAYRQQWQAEKADERAVAFSSWRKRNLAHRTAAQNARRAAQLEATPKWLSAIELAQIEEFYEISACKTTQTGIKHHVDHIVPLQGSGVRGLHVPWNLQVITALENVSKKNRLLEVAS